MLRSKYWDEVAQFKTFFAADQSYPKSGNILSVMKPSLQSALFPAQSDENSRIAEKYLLHNCLEGRVMVGMTSKNEQLQRTSILTLCK